MDNFWTGLVAIATAIVGVAVVAVLVSSRSNTAGVIGAASGGFAQDIAAAVSPVSSGFGIGNMNMGLGYNGMMGSPLGGTVY